MIEIDSDLTLSNLGDATCYAFTVRKRKLQKHARFYRSKSLELTARQALDLRLIEYSKCLV